MKPEIKEMLPPMPKAKDARSFDAMDRVFHEAYILNWLDEVFENATIVYSEDGAGDWNVGKFRGNHTGILLNAQPIKKQTPLEIAVEAINKARKIYADDYSALSEMDEILGEALKKIEAAK